MIKDNLKNYKCCKCDNIAMHIRVIEDRGFGSAFDNYKTATTIPVCSDCEKELKDEWFTTERQRTVFHGVYTWDYEDKILDFIYTLDKETQHKVLTGFFS